MSFPNNNHKDLDQFLSGYAQEISDGFNAIDRTELLKVANLMDQKIKNGNKIFSCGNGGSSAISEHFVCDFLKGASTDTDVKPIIHSLSSNTPTLTAVANDISYEDVFSFQLNQYASEDDILICISSSGNSPNILKSIECAKEIGMKTISFVGFDGGSAKEASDYCIHIKTNNYGIAEDIHHSLMHVLAQFIRLTNLEKSKNPENIKF